METNNIKFPGVRFLFAIVGCFGAFTMMGLRTIINVAIVAMVNSTAIFHPENVTTLVECRDPTSTFGNSTEIQEIIKDGPFLWSPKIQGVVLGSFYYGYCFSQIPGGRLAEIFGGRKIFGISILLTSLLTMLVPIAAKVHVGLLVTIQALSGLSQGVCLPTIKAMLGCWCPESERGVLSSIVTIGVNLGTIASMSLTSFLIDKDFMGGWPAPFYVFGSWGFVFALIWYILVSDSPLNHPFITEAEKKYILSDQTIKPQTKLPPFPWKRVLTSVPYWSTVIMMIGQDWSYFTLMTDLPTYFSTILHVKMKQNGFLSSSPYFLQIFVGLIVAWGADLLIRKKVTSVTSSRKFCNSVNGFLRAVALIGVCFAGCNVSLNVGLFMFAIGISGFSYAAYDLTFLDMAPQYAGTLKGIANTISSLTGFLTPLVVGVLTDKSQTIHQWQIVFGITVAFLVIATFIFLFFASSEPQDWAIDNTHSQLLAENSEKQIQYNTLERT